MNQRSGLLILLLLFHFAFSAAQADFKKVATTGYPFLEIPVSPRLSGMGEILTPSLLGDAEALFGNPGQLGFMESRHSIFVGYAPYLAETHLQSLGYVWHDQILGSFGLSVNQLDMGEMTHTINADPANPGGGYVILGEFQARATAIGFTYARQLIEVFSFGINVKYIQEKISDHISSNLVFDMGMLYFTEFGSLRIGGSIQNFGVDSEYLDDTFKMPMIFRLGVAGELLGSYESTHRLTLAAEALHPSNYTERLHFGTEYAFRNTVFLRTGYKFNYDEGGLTAGLGFCWPSDSYKARIDMSYTDFGLLGSVLRFGLNASF